MLKRTGFVQPDVGIYTITAMVNKTDPAEVTFADLDDVADELERFYAQPLGKYIAGSLAFTTNGGFTQPTWNNEKFQYKRTAYASFVLRGHQNKDLTPVLNALDENGKTDYRDMVLRDRPNAPRCVFTGDPAYLRVSRDMLPMFNGRGIMNFSPMGESGVPISAAMLLAIHAMPLGCIVSQGALLAVESSDPALMFEFVRANLARNQLFAHMTHLEKFPNLTSYKTRLIDGLLEAQHAAPFPADEAEYYAAPSLTAYHFSNYGASPRLQIYTLPSNIVGFVLSVQHGRHAAAWSEIVRKARHEEKSAGEELNQAAPRLTQRNLIYEDLFDLPEKARDFLRTYFLRQPLRKHGSALKNDPRAQYDLSTEASLLSWDLTALFLERIMLMQKDRIDQIRSLGDRLAEHIQRNHDRRLLRDLYIARAYWQFRQVLLRAVQRYNGAEPLCPFDTYVTIFEESEDFERQDWSLARDLLLIRIFEQLQRSGVWGQVADALEAADGEQEEPSPSVN